MILGRKRQMTPDQIRGAADLPAFPADGYIALHMPNNSLAFMPDLRAMRKAAGGPSAWAEAIFRVTPTPSDDELDERVRPVVFSALVLTLAGQPITAEQDRAFLGVGRFGSMAARFEAASGQQRSGLIHPLVWNALIGMGQFFPAELGLVDTGLWCGIPYACYFAERHPDMGLEEVFADWH